MKTYTVFTEIDGAGEYKQISFDIDALIETYGELTTIASVPELFPILGFDEKDIADGTVTIEDVEDLYPPDCDEEGLPTLGALAEELDSMEPGVTATVGNEEETFHLIPVNIS